MNARQPNSFNLTIVILAALLGLGLPSAAQSAVVRLTITKAGTGAAGGTVKSTPIGITCGTDCIQDFTTGTSVKLTATVATGYKFVNWTGGCTGTATTCTVGMTAAKTVTANFVRLVALTVAKAGGTGTVWSGSLVINCGATCKANFNLNSNVTLGEAPGAGFKFVKWTGGCTGTATTCVVAMTAAKSVTATFAPIPVALTVTKAGTGAGTVTSSPAGIDCGTACAANFNMNSSVTLTAAASAGSKFDGWGGACTGTANTCVVAMTAAKSATATFSPIPLGLTVNKAGNGKGKVTSAPAGIDCGTACAVSFNMNSSVTLTATPEPGSKFDGWGDACTGATTTCTVTMDAAKAVTATFNAIPARLTVTRMGAGKGTVTGGANGSSGIDCGNACSASYFQMDSVTLTATPDEGSRFERWLGVCAAAGGNPICTFTLGRDSTAVASFAPNTASLSVTTYQYDPMGNLTQVEDPLGNVSRTTYDSLGQAVRQLEPDADSPGDTGGTTLIDYDALGQAAKVTDPRNLETLYNTDGLGNVLSLTSPDTGATQNTFDEAGNLTASTDARGKVSTYSYDRQNRLAQSVHDGQATTYTWDTLDGCANGIGRLCAVATTGNGLAFGYDPHGRLTSRKQTIGATTLTLTQRYNADGQLDQSTTPGGNTIGYLWQDGRIAAVTVNNATVIDQLSYEPDGQVAGWAWGNGQVSERFYDLNGRPVLVNLGFDALGWGPATRGYSYDAAGRVTAITDDTDPALGASYAYDGQGRLLGEYHADGTLIQETVWLGSLPIAVIKPAAQAPLVNVYYVHADHLGAPRRVTRPSDNKTLWAWEPQDFGDTPPDENPSGLGNFTYNLRFPGQYHDTETGLYYNYYRDYDPANGRYIQSDPIGLAGGINTYSYVGGNPVNYTDPRGLAVQLPTAAIWCLTNPACQAAAAAAAREGVKMCLRYGSAALAGIWAAQNSSSGGDEQQCDSGCDENSIKDNFAKKIFGNRKGHLPDTPENRKLLEDVANDPFTTLGTDSHGNEWSGKTLDDGTQVWTQTRGGNIINGGLNETPNAFNPQTGLSLPTRPNWK